MRIAHNKTPVEIEHRIIELYQSFHWPGQIAEAVSVSRSCVDRVLRRNGVRRVMKTPGAAKLKEKRCSACLVLKPVKEFPRAAKRAIHCLVKSECRQCERKRADRWRANNIERARKTERESSKRRRLTNVQYRFSQNLRRNVREILETHNDKNSNLVRKIIGCSSAQLIAHIESLFKPGMSWDNHSRTGWHIDHKTPCSKFDLTKPEERMACAHWSNLQPLWAAENINKDKAASARIS